MRGLFLRALTGVVVAAALFAAAFLTTSAVARPAAPRPVAAARPDPWDDARIVPAKLPPWQTYRAGPLNYSAGEVCSFPLSAVPVKDGEQYRTLKYYPDGSPELQEYRGPLYARFTNEATGKSVTPNLSGYGWFHLADGTGAVRQALYLNNGGTTIKVGNRGFPAGYWVEHGQILITDNGQGSKVIHVIHATLENLCQTLGS